MSSYDAPPPSKASLLKWWKAFTKSHSNTPSSSPVSTSNPRPAPPPYQPAGRGLPQGSSGEGRVFGVSPEQSLKYASVAISMVGPDGKPYVYGYVPIVVAKCGMMLKETATQTEGIFRVSGSNKRINQLQTVFDEPPRYGKDLDWTGYSVHDAASVLRRYLNQMPEPVIPADLYLDFTAVLQRNLPEAEAIAAYQHLITLLPPSSRYLLLYLLDFLSVFVRSASANLMTASNLAVVFQPGLVSTRREGTGKGGSGGEGALLGFPGFVGGQVPNMSSGAGARAAEGAGEHGRGKEVLEFLIEQQAHFMLGLEPPLKGTKAREATEDSGYGASGVGGSPGGSRGVGMAGPAAELEKREGSGGADLARRGSEKSVERRRLRKSHDGGNGKVKRSKTLPGRSGKGDGEGSSPAHASDSPTGSPNPSSRRSKSRRNAPSSAATDSHTPTPPLGPPAPAPVPVPTPVLDQHLLSSPDTAGSPRTMQTARSGASDGSRSREREKENLRS
ncbi:Rho GTPase activation protein [Leucosporidium creatinivorum]|uniref:Rho GTPase activation protein n=1 Tax=Leucosporidium creatinivorum TaxID=106004 RepID=A0A1Y2FKW3_9BASI|nr:Rho GTPase activation protein [Leucosporidium creatinivorum]